MPRNQTSKTHRSTAALTDRIRKNGWRIAGHGPDNDAVAAYMDQHYGVGGWAYDAQCDCWVVPDRDWPGPDRSFVLFYRCGHVARSTVPAGCVQ